MRQMYLINAPNLNRVKNLSLSVLVNIGLLSFINMPSLEKLAQALLVEETIEEDGVNKLLKDAKLPKEAMLYS